MRTEQLTPRERDVAEAAVTGATTDEIAEKLFIGRRTVESHLASIYGKLGVNSRAAMVAALLDEGRAGASEELSWPPRVAHGPGLLAPVAPAGFVGREAEVALGLETLAAACDAQQRALFVGGEAGVGKSSLVGRLLADAEASALTVLVGRCEPDMPTPYGPVIAALSPFLHACPDPLAAVTGPLGGALVSAMPELAGRLPSLPEGTDAAARPRLVAEAVATTLRSAASGRATALVLEDVHWADLGTSALLRHLLLSVRIPGLVVLATFRDTELAREHPLPGLLADLWNAPDAVRINLSGLDEGEARQLGRALAGAAVSEEEIDRICRQSAGNPLYLSLVLRHLAENRGGGDLPRGLHEVVLARIRRYDPDGERALTLAAVAGLHFDVAVVRAALEDLEDLEGGSAPIGELLHKAVQAGLLVEDPEPGTLRFVHDLVRLALVEQLGAATRAELHQAIGKAMVATYRDMRSHAIAAANHLAHAAGHDERILAVRLAGTGATEALARHAMEDAARVTTDALSWLDRLGAVDELEEGSSEHGDLRLDLLLLRAEAEYGRYDISAHREAVLQAADLARRMGKPQELARACAAFRPIGRMGLHDEEIEALYREAIEGLEGRGASPMRARLNASVAYRTALTGEGFAAAALAEDAVREAEASDDIEAIAEAYESLAGTLVGSPDLEGRLDAGWACRKLADRLPHAYAPAVGGVFRSLALLCAGDREGFEHELGTLAGAATRLRHGALQAFTDQMRHLLAMLDGSLGEADQAMAEMLAAADESANFVMAWVAQMCTTRTEQDRADEVVPMVRQALRERGDLAAVRAMAAWLWSNAGDHAAAVSAIEPLLAAGLHALPQDWLLPGTIALLTPTVARVGRAEDRTALLQLLAPYRGQVLVLGMGAEVLGVADGCAALLQAGSDPAAAAADLAGATALLAQIRAPLLAAHLLADHAELTGEERFLDEARDLVPSKRRSPRLARRLARKRNR